MSGDVERSRGGVWLDKTKCSTCFPLLGQLPPSQSSLSPNQNQEFPPKILELDVYEKDNSCNSFGEDTSMVCEAE